jgi:hypothetical protein
MTEKKKSQSDAVALIKAAAAKQAQQVQQQPQGTPYDFKQVHLQLVFLVMVE